jgi:hypothetical protein
MAEELKKEKELQNVALEEHLKEENKMANPNYNKQTTQPRTKLMGGGTARRDMRSGYYPSDMGMAGGAMYKKGGRVKKKQLKASRDESYGKFGSKAKKSGKINR